MECKIKVPDGKKGAWVVDQFTVTENEASNYNLKACLSSSSRGMYIEPGTYKRLSWNGSVVMSNTPSEISDLWPIFNRRRGHILINGLGLGCVVKLCLDSKEVKTVTVVEIDQDVIDLCGPTYLKDPRVTIVHANAYEYQPPKGAYYNMVWSDIWPDIASLNLAGMKRLTRKYCRICDWHGCWRRERCEYMRAKERRFEKEMEFWDRARDRVRDREPVFAK